MVETVIGAGDVWSSASVLLKERVPDSVWQSTFAGVTLDEGADGELVLSVPNGWAKQRIESRYLDEVRAALAGAGAPDVELELQVSAAADDRGAEPAVDPLGERPTPVQQGLALDEPTARANGSRLETLNPKYTFEAFVIGSSNRFAHAASLAVAERPALTYNPLFIYGDAGLGKTHLLQAVAHFVRENYPNFLIRYVTSETFLNDYVESIRYSTQDAFRRKYRDTPDVLLVDDIQFVEGKEGFQEEFFHTFNTLYETSRQIVMTSDRSPDHIATLEDRLRTRFKWGLITDIQPPDLETRLAILRNKAERDEVEVPSEALEFIATKVSTNIRELEGALIRVTAFASLNHVPITIELAQHLLADLLRESTTRPRTDEELLAEIASILGFDVAALKGKSRQRPLVTARQIAMYVFRELTDLSYPGIARIFGGRDHTTVIHAVEKIGRLMSERKQIYDQVTELQQRLKS